jgi:glucuronokinase
MICIVLVGQHTPTLEDAIRADESGTLQQLLGLPLALLPCGADDKQILDIWWDALNKRHMFSNVYLVTNAHKYKYFERWGTANDFPMLNIVNNGTTRASADIGTLACVELVLRSKKVAEDVMVVAADKIFYPDSVNFWGIKEFFTKKEADLVACFHPENEHAGDVGMVLEIDEKTHTVSVCPPNTTAYHSPANAKDPLIEDGPLRVCPAAYCFKRETLPKVVEYMESHQAAAERTLEGFIAWLTQQTSVYGMRVPAFYDLAQATSQTGGPSLDRYLRLVETFASRFQARQSSGPTGAASLCLWWGMPTAPCQVPTVNKFCCLQCVWIVCTCVIWRWGAGRPHVYTERTYSRVGLMGNPSDGFGGKTIALLIKNFWAEVSIHESPTLRLVSQTAARPPSAWFCAQRTSPTVCAV